MTGPLPRTPVLDTNEGLTKLATYPFEILSFVGPDGYPVSVVVEATIEPEAGVVSFAAPAGLTLPADADVSLTGSHIRPQPGYGYDERRHVTGMGFVQPGALLPDRRIALVGHDRDDSRIRRG